MQLKDHPEDTGKRVWLNEEEIELLFENAKTTEQRIAFGLGARCGLRSKEMVEVKATDVVKGPAGDMVRVWKGKNSNYREAPIPTDLKTMINVFVEHREDDIGDPVINRRRRTVRNWVSRAADKCRAETNDEAWKYLSPHDLRRSWGTLLVAKNVEPGMIMEWGGWSDWETFREHYLGVYTPKMQREERSKVDWLG